MHTPAAALCYLYLECAAVFLIRSWDRPDYHSHDREGFSKTTISVMFCKLYC
jgi:hypothetical protein